MPRPAQYPHSTTRRRFRIAAALAAITGSARRPLKHPRGSHLVDIAELKSKNVGELHDLAEELDISDFTGMPRQDLIFLIEQSLLESEVGLRAEGVLEILPEG